MTAITTSSQPSALGTPRNRRESSVPSEDTIDAGKVDNRPQALLELTISGTRPQGWLPLTTVLKHALHGIINPHVALEPEVLSSLPIAARCILFVESPARSLSRWIAAGGDSNPRPVLKAWGDGARELLRRAHAAPSRTLVIDIAEAFANPSALVRAVATWSGLNISVTGVNAAETLPADALLDTLTHHLCTHEASCLALFNELHASSRALAEADPLTGEQPELGETGVVARYRDLIASEQKLDGCLKQLSGLESDLQAARDSFAQQVAQTAALKGAIANTDNAAKQHRSDSEFLLTRVTELHAALETEYVRAQDQSALASTAAEELKELSSRLAERESEAEHQLNRLVEAEARAGRLQAELETAKKDLRDKQRANVEQQRAAEKLQDSAAMQHRAELAAIQRRLSERERLALNLEQERAELQTAVTWFSGWTAKSDISRVPGTALRLVETQNIRPQRHLHFELTGLDPSGQRVPGASVRLLDHHGQPGLAIVGQGNEPLISSWRPTHWEGNLQCMVFMPGDLEGQKALQRLGSTDWLRLRKLAVLVVQHLRSSGAEASWCSTAERLLVQLQRLPPRLRYDEVRTLRVADDAGAIGVIFDGSTFGNFELNTLRLRWQPARSLLQWQRGAGHPILSWPIGADGILRDHLDIPLTGPSGRTVWQALPNTDRQLLLALLDALPGAVAHTAQEDIPPGYSAQRLADAANKLHRWARREELRLTWRSMMNRLLRRSKAHQLWH